MVVGRRGEERTDRDVDAARFLVRVLAVSEVRLVDDLGQPGQAAITQAGPLDQRLEGAVLSLMAQLHPGGVERDGVVRELRRRREHEDRLGIDEALDQPRRGDTVDVGTRAGDPPTTAKLGQIERRRLLGAGRLRASGAHGDGLLDTPDLGAAGGVEEVDVTNPLVVLGNASQLLLGAERGRLRFLVELLEHLAVARRELAVVPVARLVEEPEHLAGAEVLDLLDADQRGVAPVPLDLLREPLEVFVPLGRVGQQIGGALEGHRAQRPQPPPHADAEARGGGRQPDQQEE